MTRSLFALLGTGSSCLPPGRHASILRAAASRPATLGLDEAPVGGVPRPLLRARLGHTGRGRANAAGRRRVVVVWGPEGSDRPRDGRAVDQDLRGLGRPRGRHQGDVVRPLLRAARHRGAAGAAQPGRPREPVDPRAAGRAADGLLLAARGAGDVLQDLDAPPGRALMERAANDPRQHDRGLWLHLSEPDQARGRAPDVPVLARGELQPDVLDSAGRVGHVVAGAQPDGSPPRAPLCEVRVERHRHDPPGLHERAPGRVRQREHLLRAGEGRRDLGRRRQSHRRPLRASHRARTGRRGLQPVGAHVDPRRGGRAGRPVTAATGQAAGRQQRTEQADGHPRGGRWGHLTSPTPLRGGRFRAASKLARRHGGHPITGVPGSRPPVPYPPRAVR